MAFWPWGSLRLFPGFQAVDDGGGEVGEDAVDEGGEEGEAFVGDYGE